MEAGQCIIGSTTQINLKFNTLGTSLVVQWVRLHDSTAGGISSTPDRGPKIPHAVLYTLTNQLKQNHVKTIP